MRFYKVYRILSLLVFLFTIYCLHYSCAADCGNDCENPKTWGAWFRSFKNPVNYWKIPDLGAFLGNDKLPVEGKEHILVQFWFFNRKNMELPDLFVLDSKDGMFKDFDPKKKTKIIIHGWIGSVSSKFSETLLHAYLPTYDYNLIIVDWSSKSQKFYPTSRKAVGDIGKLVAKFITELCFTYKIKPEDLHVVGHSLGAHVAGVAGVLLENGQLGRITGLDPAFPLFSENSNDRLTSLSAHFVDVIHTCGKYLGWFGQIGHADFYPNRGVFMQPGCGADVLGKCSHRRAWLYFAESIVEPNKFLAVPCGTWKDFQHGNCTYTNAERMGEHISLNARGIYYLQTNNEEPYGLGVRSVNFKTTV